MVTYTSNRTGSLNGEIPISNSLILRFNPLQNGFIAISRQTHPLILTNNMFDTKLNQAFEVIHNCCHCHLELGFGMTAIQRHVLYSHTRTCFCS